MKRILAVLLSLLLVVAFSTVVFAEDDIDVVTGEPNVRTWTCWVEDGNEITVNKVTTNDAYIVKDLSSNWVIKQQDLQTKITDTYWSPATVWTVDATKAFELSFDVFGGTEVQFGFLYCVGNSSSGGVNLPCSADGHELAQWCKLYESADGSNWTEVDSDILPAEDALVSGMTGYEASDIHPYNGDGTTEYSEAYFVISGTVSSDAKYVKYFFAGNGRNHYWDPCVRDAIFTAPAGCSWEGGNAEESNEAEESSEPVAYDPWVDVASGCTYSVLSGTVRDDGYGDNTFTKLTDGFWSTTGTDGIGGLNGDTASIALDLGSDKQISKVSTDLWYGAWGIGEPVSVSFFYSTDGTNYTELATVENAKATALSATDFSGYLYAATLDAPVTMRYLRIDYTAAANVWTSEIGAYEYVPEETSAVAEESTGTDTPDTGDAGIIALAVISVITLAGAVVIKRK